MLTSASFWVRVAKQILSLSNVYIYIHWLSEKAEKLGLDKILDSLTNIRDFWTRYKIVLSILPTCGSLSPE